MMPRGVLLMLLASVASCATIPKHLAQNGTRSPDGLIVRGDIQWGYVFIDRGEELGVQIGQVYDILGDESHDVIGAIEVRQVWPTFGLAAILELDEGQDPLVKPIRRVYATTRLNALKELRRHRTSDSEQ